MRKCGGGAGEMAVARASLAAARSSWLCCDAGAGCAGRETRDQAAPCPGTSSPGSCRCSASSAGARRRCRGRSARRSTPRRRPPWRGRRRSAAAEPAGPAALTRAGRRQSRCTCEVLRRWSNVAYWRVPQRQRTFDAPSLAGCNHGADAAFEPHSGSNVAYCASGAAAAAYI